jgi:serine/threonine protein kinase
MKMGDPINQHIGNYLLLKEIASGAFGSVYLARHKILAERLVAVKILHASLQSPQERERLVQEAHFLEQLRHPHILPLLDVGISENKLYLVTEYANGGSLRDYIKEHSPRLLPIEQSINVLSQIGHALYYAHQKNIIHRDIKPENVLFKTK